MKQTSKDIVYSDVAWFRCKMPGGLLDGFYRYHDSMEPLPSPVRASEMSLETVLVSIMGIGMDVKYRLRPDKI